MDYVSHLCASENFYAYFAWKYTQFPFSFLVMIPNNREELIVDQDNGQTIKKFQRDNKGKMILVYLIYVWVSYTKCHIVVYVIQARVD